MRSTAGSAPKLCRTVLTDSVAAVSAGIVAGEPVLDLDYREDSTAEVDINVVRLGKGGLVEVQGTGEGGHIFAGPARYTAEPGGTWHRAVDQLAARIARG